jgi:hypothetical protein
VSIVELWGIPPKTLTIHPAFRLDLREPVLCRGNSSKIFLHMLLADVAHRNWSAFAVGDGDTKDALAQENSFGIHAERKIMPSR